MGKIVGLVFEETTARLACPHCGKEYKTGEALAKHIKDKHPDAADPSGSGGSGGPPEE